MQLDVRGADGILRARFKGEKAKEYEQRIKQDTAFDFKSSRSYIGNSGWFPRYDAKHNTQFDFDGIELLIWRDDYITVILN